MIMRGKAVEIGALCKFLLRKDKVEKMKRVLEGRNSCNRVALAPGIIAISSLIALATFPPAPHRGAGGNVYLSISYLSFPQPAVETAGYKEFSPFGTISSDQRERF